MAAPSGQQCLHTLQNRRFVVETQRRAAGDLSGYRAWGAGAALHAWLGDGQNDGKDGPQPTAGLETDIVVENPADAFDDRQSETETVRADAVGVQTLELLEDLALLVLRNAGPGVADLDFEPVAGPPAAPREPRAPDRCT